MQVELYRSQNFPEFNSILLFLSHVHEKLQKCALECTIKRLRQVPVQIIVISIRE